MRVAAKLGLVLAFVALLCVAIALAQSEMYLTIWLVLLIFVGLPLVLVTISDAIRTLRSSDRAEGFFSTGIHVTAVFAFALGYILSQMAIWSDHPFKEKHAYLPILFVALVYGYPLVMFLKAKAAETFFSAIQTEEKLKQSTRPDDHGGEPGN